MGNQYTESQKETMKGNMWLAKAYATFGYVMAVTGAVGVVVSDIPVSYIALAVFGTAAAVANGVSADRLESQLKAAESNSLEARV